MKSQKNNRLIKIVNFDKDSAVDYIDIFYGGELGHVKTKTSKTGAKAKATGEAGAKSGFLFEALKPFLDLKLGVSSEFKLSKLGETIVEKTISNTILTDFISTADEDKNITKFEDCKLTAYKNSSAFFKMFTPYLKMIKDVDIPIALSTMDETLRAGKGYYELLLNEDKEQPQAILRFNIAAFRNSYNLTDLTKMKLKIFCVKVGKMELEALDMVKEFESLNNDNNKVTTIHDIEAVEERDAKEQSDKEIEVYDVILAGTVYND
jgi:hypothetical protein